MKFAYGMMGYIAGASALVALGVCGVSYAVAPYGTSTDVMKSERASDTANKTVALATAVSDAERVPTWIAPTHKYPVSALTMKTAPRAKQLAQGSQGRGDWRLNERPVSFNGPVAMSSYAETRMQPSYQQEAPRYREPMQFREKSDPR